jgi:hypothetical protein
MLGLAIGKGAELGDKIVAEVLVGGLLEDALISSELAGEACLVEWLSNATPRAAVKAMTTMQMQPSNFACCIEFSPWRLCLGSWLRLVLPFLRRLVAAFPLQF